MKTIKIFSKLFIKRDKDYVDYGHAHKHAELYNPYWVPSDYEEDYYKKHGYFPEKCCNVDEELLDNIGNR